MTKEQQTAAKTGEQARPGHAAEESRNAATPVKPQVGEEAPGSQAEGEQAKDQPGQAAEPEAVAGAPSTKEQAPAEAAGEPVPTLEELAQGLEEAKRKAEGHWNALLRAQAELENLRKRSARDIENARKYGLERFVAELLPVKDSLELGVAAAKDDSVSLATVREGMDLTLKMFVTAMGKFGIEEVAPQDEPFNPEFHEAMSVQETEKVPSGTVLSVVQKGYLLNGRLVRPAMVIVAK